MPQKSKITICEEDLYEKKEIKRKTVRLVLFRVSNEWYGIDIVKTKEISKIDKITHLPSSPPNIAGITNLRGDILSVTDLKSLFSLPHEDFSEKSRLIVVELEDIETGFWADEVNEVIEVAEDQIHPALTTIPAEKAEYLSGICKIDNKLIGILNINKILKIKN